MHNSSDKINCLEELSRLKQPVWEIIQKYLPNQKPHKHYEIIADYPTRQGKYLRPGLVLLANQLYGGNTNDALMPAAAVQVSEDWLLIHDDFQDHSLERRHKPALNIIYGDEIAVNAGDALHLIMWQILGDWTHSTGTLGKKIYDKFLQTLLSTTEGQFMELDWAQSDKITLSKREYLELVKRKTCCYTITMPLEIGAMIASASDEQIAGIKKWGEPLGMAFQIYDDVMNLSVSTYKQGKETAGDILEGKRTLILWHLLENCSPEEKQMIEIIYKKMRTQKTEQEKEFVLNLMRRYNSIEYGRQIAREYSKQAKEIFDARTADLPASRAKDFLISLIDFVVNREK